MSGVFYLLINFKIMDMKNIRHRINPKNLIIPQEDDMIDHIIDNMNLKQ